MNTYFENLTLQLHILYVLNMHVKICANWILFIKFNQQNYLLYIILDYKNLKFINILLIT